MSSTLFKNVSWIWINHRYTYSLCLKFIQICYMSLIIHVYFVLSNKVQWTENVNTHIFSYWFCEIVKSKFHEVHELWHEVVFDRKQTVDQVTSPTPPPHPLPGCISLWIKIKYEINRKKIVCSSLPFHFKSLTEHLNSSRFLEALVPWSLRIWDSETGQSLFRAMTTELCVVLHNSIKLEATKLSTAATE